MAYYQLNYSKHISGKFESKYDDFHLRKWIKNAICKMAAIWSRPQCVIMRCTVWLLTTVWGDLWPIVLVSISCLYRIPNIKTAEIVKILPDRGQEHVYPTLPIPLFLMSWRRHNYTPRFNEVEGGYTGIPSSVRLSVRPSVCGQNRVRFVSSTIQDGSISYLHILSTNFKCVAC